MNKRDFAKGVFITNKDILDFLGSGRVRLSKTALRDFAKVRGVIVSKRVSEADLNKAISMLGLSPADLREMLSIGEGKERPADLSFHRIKKASREEVLQSLEWVRDQVKGPGDISWKGVGKNLNVDTVYVDVDRSRTTLLQQVIETRHIRLESARSGWRVRADVHPFTDKVVELLVQRLKTVTNTVIEGIELTGMIDPSKRTDFFLNLPDRLDGYSRVSISSIGFSLSKAAAGSLRASDDEESDSDDNEEGDSESAESVVKWMRISGSNVEKSTLYTEISKTHHSGAKYAVAAVQWVAEHNKQQVRYEITAKSQPVRRADRLVYSVGKVTACSPGSSIFRRVSRSSVELEVLRVLEAVENAAVGMLAQGPTASQGDETSEASDGAST